MELQVLRYVAMVSVMTFDELVSTYARHLKVLGEEDQETSSLWPHGAAATRYRQPSRTSRCTELRSAPIRHTRTR